MLKVNKVDGSFVCLSFEKSIKTSMHHIVYLSQASKLFGMRELNLLLTEARSFNERHDITGSLVYGNGQFMQVLEGEQSIISALYGRIAVDPRHKAIVKLVDMPLPERGFTLWSMAFRPLSSEQYDALLGFVTPHQWEQMTRGVQSVNTALLAQMRAIIGVDGGW